jgi:membrane-associated phospholipid phosphatase
MPTLVHPVRAKGRLKGIAGHNPLGPSRRLLALNALPHPRWLDALPNAVTVLTRGGVIWMIGVLGACLFRVPGSDRALKELPPSLLGATWVVQYPLKALFRRRRPLSEAVRDLALGKRRGARSSFPSAHTASGFASAWVLSAIWPRWGPVFFGLASSMGVNRIYLGAHHPGDVISGGLWGMLLAELIRSTMRCLLG